MSYEEFTNFIRSAPKTPDCPIQRVMTIFQSKWAMFVLYELMRETPQRFGSIQRNIQGITNTMLTSTLRDLEKRGLVSRVQYNEVPLRVEYSLTEAGEEFYTVFVALLEWQLKRDSI